MGTTERGAPPGVPPVSFAAAFARLPPPDLFSRRATRLAALAEGNPLGDYLTFLTAIAACQAALPEPPPPDPAPIAQRLAHAMPALTHDDLGAGFDATLTHLLHALAVDAAPAPARDALAAVAAMPAEERAGLAHALLDGDYPADRVAECLYVAAALQAHLAALARRLDAGALRPVADGVCPVCGGPPIVSAIVGWASADRARYCCCGLCGTQWNHVRIKCTACGETGQIQYFAIETEKPPAVSVETCGACKTYIKHVDQHRDPAIEPLADDVASYGLDILVRNDGFRRAAANPLMVIA